MNCTPKIDPAGKNHNFGRRIQCNTCQALRSCAPLFSQALLCKSSESHSLPLPELYCIAIVIVMEYLCRRKLFLTDTDSPKANNSANVGKQLLLIRSKEW